MSAFTPYKKNSEHSGMESFAVFGPKFPLNLASVFLNLPNYQKNIFEQLREERKTEEKTKRNEKFLMKNILAGSDQQEVKNITERNRKSEFEQQASRMECLVSSLGKFENGHRCIYCGKIYSRKYGLKIHIRTHTGYKPLKCKYCLRAFGDPSNLNKHVRLHAPGDTSYKCEQCGKVLVRRRDLERHVKSRHTISEVIMAETK